MSAANKLPIVVGIFGIPGSGKTSLMRNLEVELGHEDYEFYEVSKMIVDLVGSNQFDKMTERDKLTLRERAMDTIRQECLDSGRVGVVSAHFMFWSESEETLPPPVTTLPHLTTYTHILYLDVPAESISRKRILDKTVYTRYRDEFSVGHLHKWKGEEMSQLRDLCRDYGIPFCALAAQETLIDKVSTFIQDFKYHNEDYNLRRAEREIDEVLAPHRFLQTMLVIDGDSTVANKDATVLSWAKYQQPPPRLGNLLEGWRGYSYAESRSAVLVYEELADMDDFHELCYNLASSVEIHPEFQSLLRRVTEHDHVGAVIMTCGFRLVWEMVLQREGISQVAVIGGGRIQDGFVINETVKTSIVSYLRDHHRLHVVAFGDSPLDLPMLKAASQAIVVVGPENMRSKSMDEALLQAIDDDGLQADQVLLPSNVTHILDASKLPIIQLNNPNRSISKLLMTTMRDATNEDTDFRQVLCRVGWFLASDMLANLIGLEEYDLSHIQSHQMKGYRLQHEDRTSVIALMRGDEPIPLGVIEVLPRAKFLHAQEPDDVLAKYLDGQRLVVLVDTNVKTGKTVTQYLQHIRISHPTIHVVILAGAVQSLCISEGILADTLAHDHNVHLIALRATDTGNRLFNATRLP
ncbi:uracil phosphoribosyltransferase-domain-containing protein [Xylariaceae sp. FL1019]|nr:uracil phosphoribosyltransferase-domain-containing protein [Xylariaceae sp. FL1019]